MECQHSGGRGSPDAACRANGVGNVGKGSGRNWEPGWRVVVSCPGAEEARCVVERRVLEESGGKKSEREVVDDARRPPAAKAVDETGRLVQEPLCSRWTNRACSKRQGVRKHLRERDRER